MLTRSICVLFLFTVAWKLEAAPLNSNSNSAIWHKLTKRDTTASVTNQNNSSPTKDERYFASEDKTSGDELIGVRPDHPPTPDEKSSDEQSSLESEKAIGQAGDSNSDRSIDWQFLSGNPADLERELESRRRRRSVRVRDSSLSRQHRIRTSERSRAKRGTYYQVVSPADLLAAYSYLQSRGRYSPQQLSLSQDLPVGEEDLGNLASLIYELQRSGDENGDDEDQQTGIDDGDQQVLPAAYLDLEPPQPESQPQPQPLRFSPQQLAALEQLLSEEQENEDDLYPKDKRSVYGDEDDQENDQDQESIIGNDEEEEQEEEEPETYLIPAPSTEYIQIPISEAYENPYDFYQVDETPNLYDEEAIRRFDEEQLRQRIASLIDDINQQRQIERRRRRR